MLIKFIQVTLLSLTTLASAHATIQQTKGDFVDKFRQLDESLPTPNVYRNAAGEPGHEYWQQQVDYKIKASLDEAKRRIEASQDITYHNNSPDTLKYLWVQLDQNKFRNDSMSALTTTFGGIGNRGPATATASSSKPAQLSLGALRRQQF
ncbi:MAG: putative secreted protein, partial [Flavobacteriales bacterium]